MLESGSSGSVREVLSNAHSYREPRPRADDSYLSGNRREFGPQLPARRAIWSYRVIIPEIYALTGWSPSLKIRPMPPPIGTVHC